jgi:DNA-binding transcriptional LysR family regulator
MDNSALDLDAVRAFVLVADIGSFTRAADALETAQASVSLKVKRLESALGCRLLERTPRHVALTARGAQFLGPARDLLAAQARARDSLAAEPARTVRIGISDHVAGPDLPLILARLAGADGRPVAEIELATSREIEVLFERKAVDAAVIRAEGARGKGRTLFADSVGWFAAPSLQVAEGAALPLANLAAPCGLRAVALQALGKANIPWREVFVGGGVTAVGAAITAGLAVAALAARVAPAGSIDVGPRLGLPSLPGSRVVLLSRTSDPAQQAAVRTLVAALRARSAA